MGQVASFMNRICSCCKKSEPEYNYRIVTKDEKEKMAKIHQERADKLRITPIVPINPKNHIKTEKDYDQIARDWLS